MSSQSIPPFVALRKAVKSGGEYSGDVALSSLPHLAERLEAGSSRIAHSLKAELVFAEDEFGKSTVSLKIVGAVPLLCERCLEPYSHQLAVESCLTVVRHDEEAKTRLGDLEPLVVADDRVDVYRLIEDEVLLALPIVPGHDLQREPECAERAVKLVAGDWLTLSSSQGGSYQCDDADSADIDGVDIVRKNTRKNAASQSAAGEKDNPFAVLSSLKLKH